MDFEGLRFEFAHVGINARTPEEALRMKSFFDALPGCGEFRETASAWLSGDNKMELMKGLGKGSMGHLGLFVNDLPLAVKFLESIGLAVDPDTAQYTPDGELRLIYLKEEINGFRIHVGRKMAPSYVPPREEELPAE